MKKNNKFWQGFLVAGIAALAVPSFVQGQSIGSGAAGASGSTATQSTSPSPNNRTSVPDMTGANGVQNNRATNGMTDSAATNGTLSSPGSMSKDMGSTDADKRLNSQIRQSLNADTALAGAGRDIQLNTEGGQVTLQGSVSSEAEKNQIEQKVKQMNDVENVRNQLRVTSMSSPMTTLPSAGSANR